MNFVKDKVALVTGGANGIGFAITKSLLEHDAKGVVIVDISDEADNDAVSELKERFQNKLIYYRADVTNIDELKAAFEIAVSEFKNLDIVINNAGIVNESDWIQTLTVNLGGILTGTKLAFESYLPKYRSTNDAVIVNMGSIGGIDVEPCFIAYTTSKHGVVGLGRVMNDDMIYENNKIRVLTICPGGVDTSLMPKYRDNLVTLEKVSSPHYISESIVDLLNTGKRGVWILENEEPPYEVEFVPRKAMRKTSSS